MTLVNGRESDVISTQDRGLLYGDGIFETIAVRNGKARYLPQHMQRLTLGCKRLGLEFHDHAQLTEEIDHLLADTDDAVLKIILTRGTGARGYAIPPTGEVTRILSMSAYPEYPAAYYTAGIHLRLCETRLGENSRLAGIKHLCRLEQVLARSEWRDPAIQEGLMLSSSGHLIEGTMSNLFLVLDNRLITPDLSLCGVSGIMRSVIMEHARRMSLMTEVRNVELRELHDAEELFVCNSIIGLWPVTQCNEHSLDAPGPVTQQIIGSLSAHG